MIVAETLALKWPTLSKSWKVLRGLRAVKPRPGLAIARSFEVRPATSTPKGTAVVFSSVNSRNFSFYKLFEQFADCLNRVYIRDPYDHWYTSGISPEINSVDRLSDSIRGAIEDLNHENVMFFGSSMGGYASLLFQERLQIGIALSTSPQTLLDSRLPHTPKREVDRAYFDISDRLSSSANLKRVILFGADDFVDIYNVLRVENLRTGSLPLAGQDHLAAAHLVAHSSYQQFIRAFVDQTDMADVLRTGTGLDADPRCLSSETHQAIFEIVECLYLGRPSDARALITKLLSRDDRWADAYGALATLDSRNSNWAAAVDSGRKARDRAPRSVTLSTDLAENLLRAERFEEAEEAFLYCLDLRPRHYAALCGLGESLLRRGEIEQAKLYLKQAAAAHPRPEKAANLLAQTEAVR